MLNIFRVESWSSADWSPALRSDTETGHIQRMARYHEGSRSSLPAHVFWHWQFACSGMEPMASLTMGVSSSGVRLTQSF